MFYFLYEWLLAFINTMGEVWAWLTTEIPIFNYNVAPIYLVIGGLMTAGILRAITGVL